MSDLGVTLTVKHPPTKDRAGDPIPGTAAPDAPLEDCWVAPRASSEDNNLRATVFAGLTVYAPAGTVLSPHATVIVPGYDGAWEVDGLPGRWDLHGPPGGVEIPLRQAS